VTSNLHARRTRAAASSIAHQISRASALQCSVVTPTSPAEQSKAKQSNAAPHTESSPSHQTIFSGKDHKTRLTPQEINGSKPKYLKGCAIAYDHQPRYPSIEKRECIKSWNMARTKDAQALQADTAACAGCASCACALKRLGCVVAALALLCFAVTDLQQLERWVCIYSDLGTVLYSFSCFVIHTYTAVLSSSQRTNNLRYIHITINNTKAQPYYQTVPTNPNNTNQQQQH
jgi:hypothetical protein